MATASTRFSLLLTEAEREAVREKARAEHCSEAYVIRMLIHSYLLAERVILLPHNSA